MLTLALVIAGIILVFATITDIRTTEVPDWLNYAGIAAGIGLHLNQAVVSFSWEPLISLGFGLLLFVPLGLVMYYAGQWGGGDSKMMMALGALFGANFVFDDFSIAFLINTLFAGALYGLGAVYFIAFRNHKKLSPVYSALAKQKPMLFARICVLALSVLLICLAVFLDVPKIPLLVLAGMLPLLVYSLLVTKAVEKCCMLKTIPPSELREGDWIVKDVVVSGKRITGPKDLGVTKEQIAELQALSKKHKILVEIKNGIPFVPSFLLAFILTIAVGNPLMLL